MWVGKKIFTFLQPNSVCYESVADSQSKVIAIMNTGTYSKVKSCKLLLEIIVANLISVGLKLNLEVGNTKFKT